MSGGTRETKAILQNSDVDNEIDLYEINLHNIKRGVQYEFTLTVYNNKDKTAEIDQTWSFAGKTLI